MDKKVSDDFELERRVPALPGYREAFASDRELFLETARVLLLIRETPGQSQRGICAGVRERYGISRSRCLEILGRELNVLWDAVPGAYRSLLYYEHRNTTGAHLEHNYSSHAIDPVSTAEHEREPAP